MEEARVTQLFPKAKIERLEVDAIGQDIEDVDRLVVGAIAKSVSVMRRQGLIEPGPDEENVYDENPCICPSSD